MGLSAKKDWYWLCDRWEHEGYESLNQSEKLWLNTRSLIDSVNNGGLISYFYNSDADRIEDCIAALGQLRALDVLLQVERLAKLFGSSISTIEERNQIISAWSDYGCEHALCEETDNVLMPQMKQLEKTLEAYLKQHGFSP